MLARALPRCSLSEQLSLGFSAKESLYKCLNPLVHEFIEFEGARLVRVSADEACRGRFWLTLTKPLNQEFQADFELMGRYAFVPSERIETAVWLRHGSQA